MKIGILQTGRALEHIVERHGDFDTLFQQLLNGQGFSFQAYAVLDDEFPQTPTECDGWLITGSRFSAYEDLPWIATLETFLRKAYAADVPIVGICFGHQILAQAFGGKVEKYKGGWGVGPQDYQFDGIEETVTINAWHQDQVTELPKDSCAVGRSEFCTNAAILYGEKAYSIQAHPEFTNDFMSDLIEAKGSLVPAEIIEAAEKQLKAASPSPEVVAQIVSFFKAGYLAIDTTA
jgi:GMP synthase (glutamine-hydrolysing)